MEPRSDEEPSWLKKMMRKLKKSFCLKLDLQDRMYEEHVNAKKDRQRQKQLMKHFQLPVSDGSEFSITPRGEVDALQQHTVGNPKRKV